MFNCDDSDIAGAQRLNNSQILVVGDIMVDVIVKPAGPINRGSDQRARIETHPGGSAANQAEWIAHMGSAVKLASKVGISDFKRQSDALAAVGVTPCLAADAQASSGMLVTLVDPDGQRSFLCDRGANDHLDSSDLPDELLDGLAIVHLSGYAFFAPRTRKAVQDLMGRAVERGIMVTIDPASVAFLEECGRENFFTWTKGAAICFPNDDEAAALAATRDVREQRKVLAEHYPLVVFKRGPDGAEVCGRSGELLASVSAPAVNVIDTTGAGDAFLAAYLHAIISGQPRNLALARAVEAGSLATQFFGGRPSSNRVKSLATRACI